MTRRFSVLAGALLVPALLLAQGEAKIEWKPKVGQELKYKAAMTASGDFGGGQMEIGVTFMMSTKTAKVENGKVTVESSQSDMKVAFNGMEMDPLQGQVIKGTTVHNLDGTIVSSQSDMGAAAGRFEEVTSFNYPGKTVRVGESWTRVVKPDPARGTVNAKCTYTFKGFEAIDGINCWKVEYAFEETEGTTPMKATGTVWMNPDDGEMVKATMVGTNVVIQAEMPPVSANMTVTRAK